MDATPSTPETAAKDTRYAAATGAQKYVDGQPRRQHDTYSRPARPTATSSRLSCQAHCQSVSSADGLPTSHATGSASAKAAITELRLLRAPAMPPTVLATSN